MQSKFRIAIATLAASSTFSVWAGAETMHPLARGASVPQRVIVKYKNPAAQFAFLRELSRPSGKLSALREMGSVQRLNALSNKTDLFRFASGSAVRDVVAALSRDPQVEWVQPDYYLSVFSSPETFASRTNALRSLSVGFDGLLDEENWMSSEEEEDSSEEVANTNPIFERPTDEAPVGRGDSLVAELWGMARVGANRGWSEQVGSREILVADIDTGVDYNHEDLRHNMWEGIGYDFADKDAFPWDTHGHGTHTSGSIAATGGNGIGVSGVAQQASIMAVRFIGSQGYGTTSDAILSIDYAVQNGARVLSNSWGGTPEKDEAENIALEDAIKRANDANVLFVAAAGNDGKDNDTRPVYPAAMKVPNILTVASINDKDRRSFFSNYGATTVHVGAPGSNILSTVPGNKYMKNSGTSMACPHVAGLAALILAERPELSALDVKQIILESVDPFEALQGITVSGGLINVSAALERARTFGN